MKGYKSILLAFVIFMIIIIGSLVIKPYYAEFVSKNHNSRFYNDEYVYKLYSKYINIGEYSNNIYNSVNSIHYNTSINDNITLINIGISNLLNDRNIDLNKELNNKKEINGIFYDTYYKISLNELKLYLKYNLNINNDLDVSEFKKDKMIDFDSDIFYINLSSLEYDVVINNINVYYDSFSENFILYLNDINNYSYSYITDIEYGDGVINIYDEYFIYNDEFISSYSNYSDKVSYEIESSKVNYDYVSSIKKVGKYKHIFKLVDDNFVYFETIRQ